MTPVWVFLQLTVLFSSHCMLYKLLSLLAESTCLQPEEFGVSLQQMIWAGKRNLKGNWNERQDGNEKRSRLGIRRAGLSLSSWIILGWPFCLPEALFTLCILGKIILDRREAVRIKEDWVGRCFLYFRHYVNKWIIHLSIHTFNNYVLGV